VSLLQSSNVALPISATNVNYEDENNVVKIVEVRLRELDYHIICLTDEVNDIDELETTVFDMQNYISNIPNDFNKFTPFYPTSFTNDRFFNYFRF
jgi:hypothetical protein